MVNKTLGEDCLLPAECSQSMHLMCISRVCQCDDGYHKTGNNTCVADAAKTEYSPGIYLFYK
ncbi:unnamed protein product [Medioppia subpectinata]|uniref:EB domain-containing protein n=1 Tax=Medioppia subpectinata TaxID=1979941 RepID=A0A7R9PXM7_9ACAR|nr:unnamed protein product [Medioppia subpectinata]CAG2104976.1 unnamed protein product [Medioppia subpectinata]